MINFQLSFYFFIKKLKLSKMMMNLLIIVGVIAALYVVSMAYSKNYDAKATRKLNKNTLFVLAHRDDECM